MAPTCRGLEDYECVCCRPRGPTCVYSFPGGRRWILHPAFAGLWRWHLQVDRHHDDSNHSYNSRAYATELSVYAAGAHHVVAANQSPARTFGAGSSARRLQRFSPDDL